LLQTAKGAMSSLKIRLMVQEKQRVRKEAGERREQAHAASHVIRKARGLLVRKKHRVDTAAAVRLQHCYRRRHMRLRRSNGPKRYAATPAEKRPRVAWSSPAGSAAEKEACVTITVERHGTPVQWLRYPKATTRCIEILAERKFKSLGASGSMHDIAINDLHLSWRLPDPALGELCALEVLCVCRAKQQLTSIPTSIYRLNALTELRLSGNGISAVPFTIGQIPLLTHLALDNNDITELPNSIRSLRYLVQLIVSGNRLAALPPALGECHALEQIVAHHNVLDFLPASLGNLPRLRILNVANNELVSLPPSLGHIASLAELNVSSNHIVRFDESFEGLCGLLTLDASDNSLKELHENWLGHTKLRSVQLRSNNIKTLPATFMASMSMIHLDLSDNPISRFDFAFSDDNLMVPGSETTFKKQWERQVQQQVLDRLRAGDRK